MRAQSILAIAAVAGVASIQAAFGQIKSIDAATELGVRGLRLESVSAFGGYFTAGNPFGGNLPLSGALISSLDLYGVSAAIAWSTETERKSFSIGYSPSLLRSTQVSSLNSLNHRLVLRSSYAWGKWRFTVSGGAMTTVLQQQLFDPLPLSAITGAGMTFDDLAALALAGKSSAQLAALLTNAQLSLPAGAAGYYGRRLLMTRAETTLTWVRSARMSLSMSASGVRSQQLKDSFIAGDGGASSVSLIPQTTVADVSLSLNFSLTPRTTFTADAAASRVFSRVQDGYVTRSTISLGRTMSRRWFLKGDVGAGTVTYFLHETTLPRRVQEMYGGSIGFRTLSQTFLAGYNRSAGDTYGLGAAGTVSVTGSWDWRRPGSMWETSVNVAYEQLKNTVFQNLTTSRATADISRAFTRHIGMTASYGYYGLPRRVYAGAAANALGQHAVILSLTWAPRMRR